MFKALIPALLPLALAASAPAAASPLPLPSEADNAAQTGVLTLESCREMALARSKAMLISRAKADRAHSQRNEARAAWFPALDFSAAYLYNQKEISLFDSDQLLPTKSFDLATQSYQYNLVKNPMTGEPVMADGHYVPSTVAVMPKEALTYNIHNIFFGAVTLTQPVFMGGKIRAMNKLAGYAYEAALAMADNQAEETVCEVDAMYWQVVSLGAKKRLAESYIQLLDTLMRNVDCMLAQGVATRSDRLTVEVRLNSAKVDLVKVDDGLALSRMALNRLVGLPIDEPVTLADENADLDPSAIAGDALPPADMTEVYAERPDVRALELAVKARGAEAEVARSTMLPQLAAFGAYTFNTPNSYDGFKNRIGGMFSVGAMLKLPLWHWGGDWAKYKASKASQTIARLELEDAKEKIRLQVDQCRFRCTEADRTRVLTESNIAKADENLRQADLGFREGVMTITTVMEAHTAWLKARSENIDAGIDQRLSRVYLLKALGRLASSSPNN